MNEPQSQNDMITSPQERYDSLRHVSPETPCPYLADRQSRSEAYLVERLDGSVYEQLLSRGYRRAGRIVYRPRCRGCEECRQLRILVDRFAPSRSMRRVWRRNRDVRVTVDPPNATEEKFALFKRYLESQHDETMSRTYESFLEFLYDSPIETRELSYFIGERLIGISILDVCPSGLSSVYMYFDPDHRQRGLGTHSVLWEIEYCRQGRLPFYYLGYFVAGSRTMEYKSRFLPNEILVGHDRWISLQG